MRVFCEPGFEVVGSVSATSSGSAGSGSPGGPADSGSPGGPADSGSPGGTPDSGASDGAVDSGIEGSGGGSPSTLVRNKRSPDIFWENETNEDIAIFNDYLETNFEIIQASIPDGNLLRPFESKETTNQLEKTHLSQKTPLKRKQRSTDPLLLDTQPSLIKCSSGGTWTPAPVCGGKFLQFMIVLQLDKF